MEADKCNCVQSQVNLSVSPVENTEALHGGIYMEDNSYGVTRDTALPVAKLLPINLCQELRTQSVQSASALTSCLQDASLHEFIQRRP